MEKGPLTIVTGASRGLGAAMARRLLADGHRVLTIARSPTTHGTASAGAPEHWAVDLADAAPVAVRLEAWLAAQAAACPPPVVTLINNAAVLAAPAPLDANNGAALVQALRVGLEAPVLLSAAFLRATTSWPGRRRLLLVSSGLGRRAMAGSAAYCAVKAGLDHLARAVALEQATQANPARVVSLAPGVIDTDMQRQLRDADPALFLERERFAALKTGGLLDTPAHAAAKVLAYLDRPGFGDPPVDDVRDG